MRVSLRLPTRPVAHTALAGVVALGIAAVPTTSAWSSASAAGKHTSAHSQKAKPGKGHGNKPADKPAGKPGKGGPKGQPPGQPGAAGQTPAPRDLPGWMFGPLLHGAFTVDTAEHGALAAVAQRGVVTALTAGTLTVTSSDGSAQTWSIGASTHVVPVGPRRGGKVPALAVGAPVGLWGTGTTASATAVVVLVRATPPGGKDGEAPVTQPPAPAPADPAPAPTSTDPAPAPAPAPTDPAPAPTS